MKAVDSTLGVSACRERGRDGARHGARERYFALYVKTPNAMSQRSTRERNLSALHIQNADPIPSAPLKTRSLKALCLAFLHHFALDLAN